MYTKLLKILMIIPLTWSLGSYAGQVSDVAVTIESVNRFAYGNYKTARFSPSATVMIGCGSFVSVANNGTSSYGGFCQARDSVGNTAFCSITTAAIADKVNGISDYSYISFRWNENGICNSLNISTQSFYIPAGVE
jgi:hypothetical protein